MEQIWWQIGLRDTQASLTQKMLPPSLMARLRLAMLLPHLLKQPRDRGRPDRPLQLFIFPKPLSLPASSPFSPPPLRGAPFLTAAFLLRRGSTGAKARSQTSGVFSHQLCIHFWLCLLPSPLQIPASKAPMCHAWPTSHAAEFAEMSIAAHRKKLKKTEEALKECNVTRIEARRHEHSTVIEKPQRTSDDVRDTLCEQ